MNEFHIFKAENRYVVKFGLEFISVHAPMYVTITQCILKDLVLTSVFRDWTIGCRLMLGRGFLSNLR